MDHAAMQKIINDVAHSCVRRKPIEGMPAGTIAFRMWVADLEEMRIAALHQQADTEYWHGQIFKRLDAE